MWCAIYGTISWMDDGKELETSICTVPDTELRILHCQGKVAYPKNYFSVACMLQVYQLRLV